MSYELAEVCQQIYELRSLGKLPEKGPHPRMDDEDDEDRSGDRGEFATGGARVAYLASVGGGLLCCVGAPIKPDVATFHVQL